MTEFSRFNINLLDVGSETICERQGTLELSHPSKEARIGELLQCYHVWRCSLTAHANRLRETGMEDQSAAAVRVTRIIA